MDIFDMDVRALKKEMIQCLDNKIQFNYPESSTVYDVLKNVSYTEDNDQINIIVTCGSGDKVYYNDVVDIHCQVLGHITKIWITCRNDIEPRRITCFYC